MSWIQAVKYVVSLLVGTVFADFGSRSVTDMVLNIT